MGAISGEKWVLRYLEVKWYVKNSVYPVTTQQVSDRFGLSMASTRRLLNKISRSGEISKQQKSFWNGMYYAVRDYWK